MPKDRLSVVVTRRLPAEVETRLSELFDVRLRDSEDAMSRTEIVEAMKSADVLDPSITDTVDAAMIGQSGDRLKLIANYGAGVDHIDVATARQRGILVSNTPGVLTDATADMTLALMLASVRRIPEGMGVMQSGDWAGWAPTAFLGGRLSGKRLGILGMGRIGQAVAARAAACGMDILATLLAEGRSARLVRELREERQWVLDIGGSFSLQRDCSLFMLQAWLEPDRVDAVEALICDRRSTLALQPVSPAELERAQRLLINDFAFSTETPGQLAGLYGYYDVVASAAESYSYPTRIQAHTPTSMTTLAKSFLSPNAYASTILLPTA